MSILCPEVPAANTTAHYLHPKIQSSYHASAQLNNTPHHSTKYTFYLYTPAPTPPQYTPEEPTIPRLLEAVHLSPRKLQQEGFVISAHLADGFVIIVTHFWVPSSDWSRIIHTRLVCSHVTPTVDTTCQIFGTVCNRKRPLAHERMHVARHVVVVVHTGLLQVVTPPRLLARVVPSPKIVGAKTLIAVVVKPNLGISWLGVHVLLIHWYETCLKDDVH